MKTRCKFQVSTVAETTWNAQIITLNAVCGSDGENASFAAATPSGRLEFTVTNPNVIGSFKPGQYYYLDLIPAE